MILRASASFEIAAHFESAKDYEPKTLFDHWCELPVREELKREVLSQILD
jgi:hypothetical protein